MKKISKNGKKIFFILMIMVLTLLLLFSILYYNNKINDNLTINNNSFAIYIEDIPFTGEYSAAETIPVNDYVLNNNKSGCIDINNNFINNIITYDEQSGTINTSLDSSSSCYLYFDLKKYSQVEYLNTYLINNAGMWQSGLEGDGYRFIGKDIENDVTKCSYDNGNYSNTINSGQCNNICKITYTKKTNAKNEINTIVDYSPVCEADNLNDYTINTEMISGTASTLRSETRNFICYGTDSKKECLNNKNKYLYRIIGVFENNKSYYTKLIKYNGLDKKLVYNTDLDGNNYLLSTNFVKDNTWSKKIASWQFKKLIKNDLNATASNIYNQEVKENTLKKAGKTYVSDYYLSLGNILDNCILNNETCANSWINGSVDEWIAAEKDENNAYKVDVKGLIESVKITDLLELRPNIYLDKEVRYISGGGTKNNPIIIDNYKYPTLKANYSNNVVTLQIDGNKFNIGSYCYNESLTDLTSCIWVSDTLKKLSFNIYYEGEIYVHLKDYNGRIITSNKLDTRENIPPIVPIYNDKEQTIIIPKSGNYNLEAWGAQGAGPGGLGGYVKGNIYLKKDSKLNIHTGGINGIPGGGTGAYNGGGATIVKYNNEILLLAAGGGGGISGTSGGTGDSAGGSSVGSGFGTVGTNGGGGGSSPNYNGYSCHSYDCNCITYGIKHCWEVIKTKPCNCRKVCTRYKCGGTKKKPKYCQRCNKKCNTCTSPDIICYGEEIITDCDRCSSCSSYTKAGNPGHGGTNIVSKKLTNTQNKSGIQSGNGKVTITYMK